MYKQGGREDLVAKESAELELISKYLPEQLGQKELETLINSQIAELGVNSENEIGKLMGAIMPKVKGKADGKLVQKIAREALARLST